jgi:AcrR family transcriptional regulator
MAESKQPTLRQRQAQATRTEIAGAARRLFAQQGFAETTVAQIADEAGVAVQTVYKSWGTKRALLMALNDVIDADADVPALGRAIAEAEDGPALIHAVVMLTRGIVEHAGDIVRALSSAADRDADAAAALADGERRHREGTAGAARRLADLGALRTGWSVDDAGVLLGLLTSRHVYEELVRERGWSFDDAGAWVEARLAAALLA